MPGQVEQGDKDRETVGLWPLALVFPRKSSERGGAAVSGGVLGKC